MGSSAAQALVQRGARVVGFDRFDPPHDHGSSHGESRVIRLGYFEDPAYVPLLRLAFEYWRRLEARTGEQVLHVTGVLEVGGPDSALVAGSLRSVLEHDLPHELLSPKEVSV